MKCNWEELMKILPPAIRMEADRRCRETLQEVRLRIHQPPELVCGQGIIQLSAAVTGEDLSFTVNAASRYSPWAAGSVAQGYITAPGGHRVGLCGQAVYRDGVFSGLREVESVCIRVARDFPGLAAKAPKTGSVLILGAPGWGKTTLLRDLIRIRSQEESVAVADERGELFPPGFIRGRRMDVLTGATKADALIRLLRTMSPQAIAMDEITEEEDSVALIRCARCGVTLLATAHAACFDEFRQRKLYRALLEEGIFHHILTLNRNREFTSERSAA